MRRTTIIILIAVLTIGCGGGGNGGGNSHGNGQQNAAWFQAAEVTATNAVTKDYNSPSIGATGAIVAVSTPQGSWLQGFGTSDSRGTPMNPNLSFRIASITKLFTAEAVLELVDQGMVEPTDLINKYIANPNPKTIPDATWNEITILSLANHTSGLGDLSGYPAAPYGGWTPAGLLPYITEQNAKPFGQYMYENSNFIVLGQLLFLLTGKDESTLFNQMFIGPLHLGHTSVATSGTSPTVGVQGFGLESDSPSLENVTNDDPTWSSYAGSMVSTAPDLIRWIRAVGQNKFLTPATEQIFLKEVGSASSNFTGFGVQEYSNGWIGHSGRIDGYSTGCFYNPTLDAAVVVMVNRMDYNDGTTVNREIPIIQDVVKSFFPTFNSKNW